TPPTWARAPPTHRRRHPRRSSRRVRGPRREVIMEVDRRRFLKVIGGGAGMAAAAAAASAGGVAQARPPKQLPDEALGLLFDGTLCIGCRACIPACKEANGMPPEHTQLLAGDYWDAPLDISGKTLNIIKAYRAGSGEHKDQVEDGFAFTK